MDLIVLRTVPRPNPVTELRPANIDTQTGDSSRLISIDEVRRKWAKKQEARRALLSYTPQPA